MLTATTFQSKALLKINGHFGLKYWAFTKAFLPEAEGCLSVYLEEKEV